MFSLSLSFHHRPLGVVLPDSIHYPGQTTASTIIILPQPRHRALSLSSPFTLRICSQQQLWRRSIELADVNMWMSGPFPLCFAVLTSGVLQSESSTYSSLALQLWLSGSEVGPGKLPFCFFFFFFLIL